MIAGTGFPTRRQNGHNLEYIAQILRDTHDIELSNGLLDVAACSQKVHYEEETLSENQALATSRNGVADGALAAAVSKV